MSSRAEKLIVGSAVIVGMSLIVPQIGLGVGERPGIGQSTSISISSSVPAFHGQVKSGAAHCESGRRVKLFRKRPGARPSLLGNDISNDAGRWEIGVANLRSGAYFARVKPKGRSRCEGARSGLAVID